MLTLILNISLISEQFAKVYSANISGYTVLCLKMSLAFWSEIFLALYMLCLFVSDTNDNMYSIIIQTT